MLSNTSSIFQNFTNTHAPVEVIRERFEQVVNLPGVVGLSVGTRPDCLPPEVVDYLAELNQRLYLWGRARVTNHL